MPGPFRGILRGADDLGLREAALCRGPGQGEVENDGVFFSGIFFFCVFRCFFAFFGYFSKIYFLECFFLFFLGVSFCLWVFSWRFGLGVAVLF